MDAQRVIMLAFVCHTVDRIIEYLQPPIKTLLPPWIPFLINCLVHWGHGVSVRSDVAYSARERQRAFCVPALTYTCCFMQGVGQVSGACFYCVSRETVSMSSTSVLCVLHLYHNSYEFALTVTFG